MAAFVEAANAPVPALPKFPNTTSAAAGLGATHETAATKTGRATAKSRRVVRMMRGILVGVLGGDSGGVGLRGPDSASRIKKNKSLNYLQQY
jgi:hypothetical protein